VFEYLKLINIIVWRREDKGLIAMDMAITQTAPYSVSYL